MKELFCKVCGMIINEKNYDVNGKAIPKENSINEILYCPFCGARIEYLVENKDEIYNVDVSELDEKTITILDHAVKLEVFNGDFYKQAAIMVDNENIKKMFEGLSRIEYVHARIHQRLGGFKELPTLTKIDYKRYDTDNKLLELAAKREEHAVQYYKKYSKEVSSNVIVEVFNALSIVETDHVHLSREPKFKAEK
jgi:rubrerythrin